MMKVAAVKNYYLDYEEDWKHEDGVHGSKGQDNPFNSSWCKLPEFISHKEL
jgi:hypothetical protein